MSENITTNKKSNKKVIIIIICAVVALLAIVIIAGGIIISKMSSNFGTPVDVVQPANHDISSSVTTSGTISSGDITSYTTSVTASVDEINIRPGQTVKKGDTLLTFDTSALEDQYNQAALTARSNQLTNQATIEQSNQTSSDLEQAKKNVASLKTQISNLEAEITELQNSTVVEDPNSDLLVALTEKRTQLATVLDTIQTLLESTTDSSTLSSNPDYINACNERDTLQASIKNLENIISTLPDESSTISAAISAKTSELADLQSQLAQQEALVDSAEAGILTATQKEQLNISNQLANLQKEAAATSLEEGKAGIVADKDGIITSVDVVKGATTGPGMTLFTIASTDSIKVTVPLSKKDMETVSLGQTATVTLLDHEYTGKVTYISKIATTTATGATSIEAEVTIQNPDENIILGLDAKVVIHTASVEDVMSVPNLAINVDTEGTFVYAVEDNLVVKKYVETGVSDVDNCEILSGIDADTMVITNVTAMITEGLPVNPILPEDETGISETDEQQDSESKQN